MFFQKLFKQKEPATQNIAARIQPEQEQAPGALFWFDWDAISQAGHGFYGGYVYGQLIPFLSPRRPDYIPGMYTFFDGDCLPQGTLQFPYVGVEESLCLNSVIERGLQNFYVVSIYKGKGIDFDVLHRQLGTSKVIGYMGKTSCPGMSWNEFTNFASKMALPLAVQIINQNFEKINFAFMDNQKLNDLGFTVTASIRR